MTASDVPGAMRASDADRSKAQTILNDSFADGRLTRDEWDERSGQLAVAATYAELGRLTADLPAQSPDPAWGDRQPVPVPPPPLPVLPGTNSMATAALVCGLCQLFVGFPAGIAAILVGRRAQKRIRETGEDGSGLATAGIVLGYVGIGFSALIVLLILLGFVVAASHG